MRALTFALALAALAAAAAPAGAQQAPAADPAKVQAVVKAAFPKAPADWQARLEQDATMRECTAHGNNPPKAASEAIRKREAAAIEYPPDGKFLGDWQKGEALAQSGYGLRFTDTSTSRPNGGNCYACHKLTRTELSYGTIGPSLGNYGKIRDFGAEDAKAVYEKIYNSHAAFPCSLMPRFGANKILTIEQIKDLVALLMSPESPVNKE
ncbi:MAG: sulfur oxidation c-type cytochrome SoxX [Alphaproteobacteria bacterium]|nr:sulfur oxidation c-type cytochrome SoxX [Alphaproteobacteria bacterium]